MRSLVEMLLLALSVVCAIAPMLTCVAFMWWMDRYDREPLGILLITFMWGAVGAIFLAMITSAILSIPIMTFVPWAADVASTVVIAPLIEEPAKALCLIAIARSRHFDNMTDGFVYGATAGLGFAMTENFLYFATLAATGDVNAWAATVVIRTAYSAMMHAGATSVVGAALGFSRFRSPGSIFGMGLLGLGIAMGIHALWNGLITLDSVIGFGGALSGLNLVLFPMEFAVLVGIFNLCLLHEKITIRRELLAEARDGLLPESHAHIIASYCARSRHRWVPLGVDHDRYVSAATTLAMRRRQVDMIGERTGFTFFQEDLERARHRVAYELSKARGLG